MHTGLSACSCVCVNNMYKHVPPGVEEVLNAEYLLAWCSMSITGSG